MRAEMLAGGDVGQGGLRGLEDPLLLGAAVDLDAGAEHCLEDVRAGGYRGVGSLQKQDGEGERKHDGFRLTSAAGQRRIRRKHLLIGEEKA